MILFLEYILLALVFVHSGVEGKSCPEGYCRHSGGCYLVVGLNETWIDARNYCSVLGGALLSISTSTMQTAVEGAIRRSKGLIFPGSFWLDITDFLNPKDWKTMSTRTSLSYSNWKQDDFSVNDTMSENCVYMSETHDFQWKPAPCDSKMNFVCYKAGTGRALNSWGTSNRYKYRNGECIN